MNTNIAVNSISPHGYVNTEPAVVNIQKFKSTVK